MTMTSPISLIREVGRERRNVGNKERGVEEDSGRHSVSAKEALVSGEEALTSDGITKWVTSDLHFGHRNVLGFRRKTRSKWSDVDEMNEGIIEEWNSKVKPGDIIYHLGDFSFMKGGATREILERLNGSKFFILGNHDKGITSVLKDYGHVYDYYETIFMAQHTTTGRPDYVKVCMSHYPMREWNQNHRGSLMLHGHTHGTIEMFGRSMDVGYDSLGEIARFDDVCNFLLKRDIEVVVGGHGYPVRPHHVINYKEDLN